MPAGPAAAAAAAGAALAAPFAASTPTGSNLLREQRVWIAQRCSELETWPSWAQVLEPHAKTANDFKTT